MRRPLRGKIVVDFAASYETARTFAKTHGLRIARDEYGKDGIVALSAPFQSLPTFKEQQGRLIQLGWPVESQTVRYTEEL